MNSIVAAKWRRWKAKAEVAKNPLCSGCKAESQFGNSYRKCEDCIDAHNLRWHAEAAL